MNHFLKWLGEKLFPGKVAEERSLRESGAHRPAPPRRKPAQAPVEPRPAQFKPTTQGRIENAGPGKNVLVRNRFVREDSGTHETLKIIDESLLDSGEEAGIDPYNTGRFDRAKTWDTRIRK